jgi:ABC-type Fe3+-hydroxamate transport system substrate-binding protein
MLKAARKHLSAVAMLAVAGALVVGGVAVAQDDGSATQDQSGQSGKGGKPIGPPPGGMPFKGLTYGELHVRTKSGEDKVIRIDQGKVSSVSADSITVTENDGNEVTIAVDEDTKVLGKPGSETTLDDLAEGQQVTVSGPSGAAAEMVAVMPKKGDLPKGGPGKMPPPPGAQQGSSE